MLDPNKSVASNLEEIRGLLKEFDGIVSVYSPDIVEYLLRLVEEYRKRLIAECELNTGENDPDGIDESVAFEVSRRLRAAGEGK